MLKKFKENILTFGKVCLPSTFTLPSPEFHYEIASALQNPEIQFLNIIAPRGHAKSSLVAAVYVLWHMFCTPGRHVIVLSSKTQTHSKKLLMTIKDILDYSEPFRFFFGYHGRNNSLIWREDEIKINTGDAIFTRGTGQQVLGIKDINQRPTLIVADDLEDLENTISEKSRADNLKWFLTQLYPARDVKRSKIVSIGTPQHEQCIVYSLRDMMGWKTLQYDAELDEATKTSLWPELWSWKSLMEEKDRYASLGKISWYYREYRCQIVGDEEQLFKEKYLQYWKGSFFHNKDGDAFIKMEDNRIIAVNVFMGVDPASTISASSDYSTCVVVGIDIEGNRYVIAYFHERVTPMTLADAVLTFYDMYKPQRTRVESTGYQEMLREYLRSRLYIPGLELKETPRGPKSNRLESMQPFFASMKVWLKEGMTELRDELLLYPRAKHDDLLDGLFYAMKGVFKPYHAYQEEKNDLKKYEDVKYYVGLVNPNERRILREVMEGPKHDRPRRGIL